MKKKSLFISYAVNDKDTVAKIVEDLQQWNYDIWIYPKSILPGDFIVESEEKGMSDCDHVLLMLSESSNHSPAVDREKALAKSLAGEKKLIYCRIDDKAPLWSAEGVQICDLYHSSNYTTELLRLIKSIDNTSRFKIRSSVSKDEFIAEQQWYKVNIWLDGTGLEEIIDVTYYIHPDIVMDENTDWELANDYNHKFKLTFYTPDPEIIYCNITLADNSEEEIRYFLKLK
ncbi:TIR domain-containing protein [Chitinophaga dinghuensis]|uniref:TIR domain-containing protein n=1 Tax=Chitinophaga dinghuensis TaxID=1539050 RepID=A0A327VZ22_9BACT|nr:toll/interleukin-1 receptor domain-containing protein [Chitinophaga dinghuensis]RAJ80390.1 TIR domain-containing protein [Chitinophaga dinghuensis]